MIIRPGSTTSIRLPAIRVAGNLIPEVNHVSKKKRLKEYIGQNDERQFLSRKFEKHDKRSDAYGG